MGEKIIEMLVVFVTVSKNLFVWLIFAKVILSWIPSKPNPLTRFIDGATAPLFNLARKVTPRLGMLDLSPIVAYLGVGLIAYVLLEVLNLLAPTIINLFG
jgi:YggT family protein